MRRCKKGDQGEAVVELQMRLSGFRGTVPDDIFGPGTELQVAKFQNDYMAISTATNIVDAATFAAIDEFANDYPINFASPECPCGICDEFGQGRFKGDYHAGKPVAEPYHLYEYPGIHRVLLWSVRALKFYIPQYNFVINSGYRCAENNRQKKSNQHQPSWQGDRFGCATRSRRRQER